MKEIILSWNPYICLILAIIICIMQFRIYIFKFKIAYYEQKLKNRNIKDSMLKMSWWKLFLN